MKRMLLIVLAMILSISACAEGDAGSLTVYRDIASAMGKADQWRAQLNELTVSVSDEDSLALLEMVSQRMSLFTYQLILAADPAQPAAVEAFADMDVVEIYSQPDDDWCFVQSAWQYLQDEDIYVNCSVQYSEQYIRIDSVTCDVDGALSLIETVELAQREDGQILLLYIRYDEALGTTGRYAALINGDRSQSIYTRTFGMTLDVVLDVNAWANGNNYDEWSKALLYPVSYLNQ